MRMPRWLVVALGVVGCFTLAGPALIGGCLPEQERTPYGPPSVLGNYDLPAPAGGSLGAQEGGAPVDPNALCNGAGPIFKSGDTCAIKWSTDLFPQMKNDGPLKCSNPTCHGLPSTQAPTISDTDPSVAWGQLTKFTNANLSNKVYIDPCVKDENASAFTCNLGGCGTQMPYPGVAATIPAPDDFKTKLKTWLQCGAPNN